jgi:hypothetical protein
MRVIGSTVKKTIHFGDFLITKVGDERTKEAFVCEIYLIKHEPAEQQTDYSREDLPLMLKPAHNLNYLLARTGSDSGGYLIGGITMSEQDDKVVFSVDQRAKHQYRTEFDISRPGETRKTVVPWEGGVIDSLTLTRDYQPNWTSLTYTGPPQVRVGDP